MELIILCDGYNPIPYKRTTQKQKYSDKGYHRYQRWKNLIVSEFVRKFKVYPSKVFKLKQKYYVHILVYYKDMTHGDTDNVFKGVLDAIFDKPLNDKYICGSMDYFYNKENPRVEIKFCEDDI